MLEEIIDNNGNVISTKKRNIVSLNEAFHLFNKNYGIKGSYKLGFFKKLFFSLFVAGAFIGSIHIANKKVLDYQRKNNFPFSYQAYTISDADYCRPESICLLKNFRYGDLKINSLIPKIEEKFQIEFPKNYSFLKDGFISRMDKNESCPD